MLSKKCDERITKLNGKTQNFMYKVLLLLLYFFFIFHNDFNILLFDAITYY
jgi:hypothetical protein